MQMNRTPRLLSVLATLLLLLAACGGDGGDTTAEGGGATPSGGESTGGAVDTENLDLVSEGTLTVCTDSPYQPFEFEESGEFTGFDVEVMNAIAENIGLETEYRVTPFESLQSAAALQANQCDIAASAMTITPERAERLLFSDPYFNADQSLLVSSDQADQFATLEDLAGQPIGVQASTTGQAYAEGNAPADARIVQFPDSSALFTALQGGQISAVLQDFPVNGFFASQNDGVEVVETYPTGEQYGFAAEQGATALVDAVNQGLGQVRESGTYEDIYVNWFDQPPPSASESASPAPSPTSS